MGDGITLVSTKVEAIDLLQCTKDLLAESNLRLHKITSSAEVMEAFYPEEQASDFKDLDLGAELFPLQHSLGVSWELNTDSFTFRVLQECSNSKLAPYPVHTILYLELCEAVLAVELEELI